MKTAILVTAFDTVTNLYDIDWYDCVVGDITRPNIFSSPKLQSHTVSVAVGRKAINELYAEKLRYHELNEKRHK